MDMKDVKIVRAFWGTDFTEVPTKPLFNEIVYVFGNENCTKLQQLGYEVELISIHPDGGEQETNKFLNKLKVLHRAGQDFNSFIFLDWDMKLLKPLDDSFYNSLDGKEVLMPTYAYPKEYLRLKGKLQDPSARAWTDKQIPLLKKWSWKLEDTLILPNAGFIYVNKPGFAKELFKIVSDYDLDTNVEEFAFFIYANCSLDEYIEEYEPIVCFGRPVSNTFELENISRQIETILHNHIQSLIKKDEYFLHL